ncbi:DNA mismatch repair MutS family like protein [Aduncisulcus paluster]|uniref:DNA mismatch repair MutS family like protein n=1 Tax=Aduncisulcus paluster TaxID=2918883 RepID=A0ABQ5KQ06_9EUKA|nr:DNA mismatch repair MutS family like protein [Aduncisulcus paluster]
MSDAIASVFFHANRIGLAYYTPGDGVIHLTDIPDLIMDLSSIVQFFRPVNPEQFILSKAASHQLIDFIKLAFGGDCITLVPSSLFNFDNAFPALSSLTPYSPSSATDSSKMFDILDLKTLSKDNEQQHLLTCTRAILTELCADVAVRAAGALCLFLRGDASTNAINGVGNPNDNWSSSAHSSHPSRHQYAPISTPLASKHSSKSHHKVLHGLPMHIHITTVPSFMHIDPKSAQMLGITSSVVPNPSLTHGTSRESLSLCTILDRAITKAGSDLIRLWVCRPSLDIGVIRARYAIMCYFKDHPSLLSALRQALRPLKGLSPSHSLISSICTHILTDKEWRMLIMMFGSVCRCCRLVQDIDDGRSARFGLDNKRKPKQKTFAGSTKEDEHNTALLLPHSDSFPLFSSLKSLLPQALPLLSLLTAVFDVSGSSQVKRDKKGTSTVPNDTSQSTPASILTIRAGFFPFLDSLHSLHTSLPTLLATEGEHVLREVTMKWREVIQWRNEIIRIESESLTSIMGLKTAPITSTRYSFPQILPQMLDHLLPPSIRSLSVVYIPQVGYCVCVHFDTREEQRKGVLHEKKRHSLKKHGKNEIHKEEEEEEEEEEHPLQKLFNRYDGGTMDISRVDGTKWYRDLWYGEMKKVARTSHSRVQTHTAYNTEQLPAPPSSIIPLLVPLIHSISALRACLSLHFCTKSHAFLKSSRMAEMDEQLGDVERRMGDVEDEVKREVQRVVKDGMLPIHGRDHCHVDEGCEFKSPLGHNNDIDTPWVDKSGMLPEAMSDPMHMSNCFDTTETSDQSRAQCCDGSVVAAVKELQRSIIETTKESLSHSEIDKSSRAPTFSSIMSGISLIRKVWRTVIQLDAICGLCVAVMEYGWAGEVKINKDSSRSVREGDSLIGRSPYVCPPSLDLNNIIHPIASLIHTPYSPSSINIGASRPIFMLSGPNMSGKTQLCTSAVLNIALCGIGIGLPGRGCVTLGLETGDGSSLNFSPMLSSQGYINALPDRLFVSLSSLSPSTHTAQSSFTAALTRMCAALQIISERKERVIHSPSSSSSSSSSLLDGSSFDHASIGNQINPLLVFADEFGTSTQGIDGECLLSSIVRFMGIHDHSSSSSSSSLGQSSDSPYGGVYSFITTHYSMSLLQEHAQDLCADLIESRIDGSGFGSWKDDMRWNSTSVSSSNGSIFRSRMSREMTPDVWEMIGIRRMRISRMSREMTPDVWEMIGIRRMRMSVQIQREEEEEEEEGRKRMDISFDSRIKSSQAPSKAPKISFLYHVEPGISPCSFATSCAVCAGVSPMVVDRAEHLLACGKDDIRKEEEKKEKERILQMKRFLKWNPSKCSSIEQCKDMIRTFCCGNII